MNKTRLTTIGALWLVVLFTDPHASAAAQRTFVAATGNDSNACSLVAPCRSFAAALAQTNPKGEIVVLDSAGYGPVTINKPVTIIAPAGIYAGISVLAGDGVTVSANTSDEVMLRGLTVNAQGGLNGVVFNSGTLHLDGCTIRGFNSPGAASIRYMANNSSRMSVTDSLIVGGTSGILLYFSGAVLVDNTRIEGNGIGVSGTNFSGSLSFRNTVVTNSGAHAIDLQNNSGLQLQVSIDSSLLFRNAGNGLNLQGGNTALTLRDSTIAANSVGVYVEGGTSASVARLTGNVISKNATGIQSGFNGSILTPLSNTIEGNAIDGTASGNYTTK